MYIIMASKADHSALPSASIAQKLEESDRRTDHSDLPIASTEAGGIVTVKGDIQVQVTVCPINVGQGDSILVQLINKEGISHKNYHKGRILTYELYLGKSGLIL